jgi:hypothetical protein
MDNDDNKLRIKGGTCENCFMIEVSPKTQICPVCKTPDPYISVGKAIPVLLQSGYGLRAVGFLVKFKGWTVSKAIEYCKNVDTGLDLRIVSALDDLIEQMVKDGQKVKLIKLVRELSPAQFGWGLKQAKEFVDVMFPNIRANKQDTKDTEQ